MAGDNNGIRKTDFDLIVGINRAETYKIFQRDIEDIQKVLSDSKEKITVPLDFDDKQIKEKLSTIKTEMMQIAKYIADADKYASKYKDETGGAKSTDKPASKPKEKSKSTTTPKTSNEGASKSVSVKTESELVSSSLNALRNKLAVSDTWRKDKEEAKALFDEIEKAIVSINNGEAGSVETGRRLIEVTTQRLNINKQSLDVLDKMNLQFNEMVKLINSLGEYEGKNTLIGEVSGVSEDLKNLSSIKENWADDSVETKSKSLQERMSAISAEAKRVQEWQSGDKKLLSVIKEMDAQYESLAQSIDTADEKQVKLLEDMNAAREAVKSKFYSGRSGSKVYDENADKLVGLNFDDVMAEASAVRDSITNAIPSDGIQKLIDAAKTRLSSLYGTLTKNSKALGGDTEGIVKNLSSWIDKLERINDLTDEQKLSLVKDAVSVADDISSQIKSKTTPEKTSKSKTSEPDLISERSLKRIEEAKKKLKEIKSILENRKELFSESEYEKNIEELNKLESKLSNKGVKSLSKKDGESLADSAAEQSAAIQSKINNTVKALDSSLRRINNIETNLSRWGAADPKVNSEAATYNGDYAYNVLESSVKDMRILRDELSSGKISVEEFDAKYRALVNTVENASAKIKQANQDLGIKDEVIVEIQRVKDLYNGIGKYLEKNTRAKDKSPEGYNQLKSLQDEIGNVITTGEEITDSDFKEYISRFKDLKVAIHEAGAEGKTAGDRIKGLAQKFSLWVSAQQIVIKLIESVKQMVSTVIELDTAMTELKKVTDATDKQYEQFFDNAVNRAKELGATVTDVINASATFARLGYGLEDAAALADAALVYKNVGDGIEDINTASESIISTMQAFGIAASDSMTIVDKFNEVGNNFAISSSGLGEALLRSASALHAANNTLEESIGLATAANTILQDPESVGTTLKTISMYLRAAKTEAEDAGESTDGMADSVSKLRDEILSLTGDKVDIMEATGTEFKSTTQILRELAGVWDELTDVTQANILEKIGGKRNANATSALITNFNIVEDAIKTASEAEGSALAENAKYLESIQGHIDRFKASFQELSALVVDSDVVKFFVDFGKVILDILNVIMKIADALGGLKNALGLGLSITLVKNVDAILEAIGGKLGKFTQILNDIKIAKLAALKGNTVEGITETLQGSTLAAQTLNQELSTMNVGVKDLTKGVKGFYKAMSTAQKAVLWIAIITTIFEIISKIVNKVKEANSLEVKLEALEESKTNIEDLNSQIEEIQETIDEINSSGSALSLTDKEDLKRLQEENAELKLQLELEKQIAAAKREEAAKVARKNVDAKMDEFNPMVEGGYAYSYFDDYNDYLEEMDALNEELADAIASSDTDNASKISDKISKTKGFYADFLDSLKSDLDNYYDWLGVLDENNPLDKERIDWINDRINEISVIIDKVGFVESKIQSLPSDVLNELENLGEYGSVTVATIAELYEKYPEFRDAMVAAGYTMADLAEHFNNLGESASDSSEELKSFKDGLDGIQNLSGGFETLGKIYADIQDGGDFDFSSIFANDDFEDTFGGLGGSYDAFIETISKSPRNIASCQEAFNNLVTEWIDGTGVLNDLNESNKSVAITMLNQMGITNAAAIVEERLGIAKAKSKLESEGLADATEAELVAKYNSANATDAERAAIAELIIERLKYNKAKLDTSGDIAGIVGLAKACGVAASAISRLSYLKSKYDEYVAVGNTRKAESYLAQMEATEKSINASVTEYLGAIYSPYTYGGSPSSSSESSSDSETWFEKQLKEHQHRINMDQETTAEYLAWLEKAYKQAYTEGIITLDDYYKYAEEVYSGLHDLFTSHLDDVETQIENMGRYADSGDEILKVYDSVLLEIEKEIAAARAQGLTDETEYIKTLKEKYWSFYDARKEMLKEYGEDSKSAMEDLIDMRVDMLKQDIENERDALDEKLDALHDFYDKQRELLDEMADEEDYQKDQAEKRKAITDLKLQLAQLENDDSAWAAKRRIELNEELQDAEEALSEFERDKAREVAKKALDDAEESETKVLEDRISELEKLLDDPYALRQRAIADLRENNGELYQEMIDWNKKYGDGIDETITSKWEEAYIACQKYFSLLKSYYEDISLDNMTGYEFVSGGGQAKTIGGVPKYNAGSDYAKLMAAAANSGDMELAAIYEEYRNRKIRENGLNYSTTNQYSKYLPEDYSTSGIPSYNPNLDYWTLMNEAAAAGDYRLAAIYERYRNRKIREIGLKQSTTDMYTKYLPSGYASGTKYATEGIHKFDEDGSEYIFTSANGSRYRLFSAGDKVLPSGATNFLYDFALKGQDILGGITKKLNEVMYFGSRSKSETPIINMGDIIIQGNANDKTVSEIRRAQREGIDYILKEFGKLKA